MFKLMNKIISSTHGVHCQGKSQGKTYFFKVRELSGNFEIGQGNLKNEQKVRKKSGNFEITSL